MAFDPPCLSCSSEEDDAFEWLFFCRMREHVWTCSSRLTAEEKVWDCSSKSQKQQQRPPLESNQHLNWVIYCFAKFTLCDTLSLLFSFSLSMYLCYNLNICLYFSRARIYFRNFQWSLIWGALWHSTGMALISFEWSTMKISLRWWSVLMSFDDLRSWFLFPGLLRFY